MTTIDSKLLTLVTGGAGDSDPNPGLPFGDQPAPAEWFKGNSIYAGGIGGGPEYFTHAGPNGKYDPMRRWLLSPEEFAKDPLRTARDGMGWAGG